MNYSKAIMRCGLKNKRGNFFSLHCDLNHSPPEIKCQCTTSELCYCLVIKGIISHHYFKMLLVIAVSADFKDETYEILAQARDAEGEEGDGVVRSGVEQTDQVDTGINQLKSKLELFSQKLL